MDQGSTGQPFNQPPVPGSEGAKGAPATGLSRQVGDLRKGFTFSDFITFRYMITGPLITVLYILAVIGITVAALAAINTSFLGAVLGWVFVMIWVRVIFEVMIILFRINDGIQTIARQR